MACKVSVYKEDIVRLNGEGKTYKQIKEELSCSISIISYHLSCADSQKIKNKTEKVNTRMRSTAKKVRDRNRAYLKDYLSTHACVDCGNKDIRVLDFDHVRGEKVNSVSNGVKRAWSIEKISKEIEKCEIRCANCHRIVTHERRVKSKITT